MLVRSVVAIGLLATGCFYVDPIQTRSLVVLDPRPGEVPVVRGDELRVTAKMDRPGRFEWRAFACADKAGSICGDDGIAPYPLSGTSNVARIQVPVRIPTLDTAPLTQSIRVEVIARDDRGAIASALGSDSSVAYPVDDAPPSLELHQDAHSLTVGAPIDLFALYGDPDDPLETITLAWEAAVPLAMSSSMLDDSVVTAADTTHLLARRRLVPMDPGHWDVKVTAQDPLNAITERHLLFTVLPDRPPCLVQARPITPPVGVALPVTEPTLFQVARVTDDLDSYPRLSTDPLFGTTAFAWSILPPSASARQLLVGTTGNTVDFDPGGFTPGDIVELRVEIFDRKRTPIPCPDDLATCAIEAAGCVQRQTWRLEAR